MLIINASVDKMDAMMAAPNVFCVSTNCSAIQSAINTKWSAIARFRG